MQKKCNRKLLSLILSMMLIVAMAFSMTACGDNNQEKPNTEGQSQAGGTEQDSASGDVQDESGNQTDATVLGEGATVFNFIVVDKDGNETAFEVHTDKKTVGEALLEVSLIEGEEGPYGLYVKKVNGITADYDVDSTYWALYIDNAYALSGASDTPIEEGKCYTFRIEK